MDLPVCLVSDCFSLLGRAYGAWQKVQAVVSAVAHRKPPRKNQLKHASTVRKPARKGATGEGGKEGDKRKEREESESRRRGKKVNHNRAGLVSFGVFAFSG